MGNVLGILESSEQRGHAVRVIFEQLDDRVSHRIEVLDPSGYRLAQLQSVEGTSAEEWPASPALQTCSLQEVRPDQPAAFLVGMAGKSHWSASVEAIPKEGALVFDVACRVHDRPQWLGTTYLAEYYPQDGITVFQPSKSGIAAAVYGPDDSCWGLSLDGQKLKLPCQDKASGFPITLRWQYRIYLAVSISG